MGDVLVRMGDAAVTREAGDVLVALGLGSCIGLALLARDGSAAGLAHIVLPSSREAAPAGAGKFADTAVPKLLAELGRAGVPRCGLDAVLVGGAQMFGGAGGDARLEIGARNERAVREALLAAGVPVAAAVTGGSTGRTVKVRPGQVLCKEAGAGERVVFADGAAEGHRPAEVEER